ncbi:jg27339 [Pararge aegeria aegeria]|uniref:Jg27339 protein n=1 Tax=Pararge aegeria aegeria TaxID=348720 RepID=A0A8S4SCV5_9NEOP|nr:jg27339 [Pararge aegeria aegeria]
MLTKTKNTILRIYKKKNHPPIAGLLNAQVTGGQGSRVRDLLTIRAVSRTTAFCIRPLIQQPSERFLRCHGKTHKDAASVRATHPIPAACGLYYFEVRIVSKGRDGYMGIGLSAHGVNMNRLPGWDKHSYGYHGDDGHSFCSSGTGQPYGPTFTTGDVIGCGVNLVDNTCFYTKNGHHLGIAFRGLPVCGAFIRIYLLFSVSALTTSLVLNLWAKKERKYTLLHIKKHIQRRV